VRQIAGSRRMSQHSYGNAIDIDQSSRNQVSPALRNWASSHPAELRAALNRNQMISGGDWRNPDFGHFEWGGGKGLLPAAREAGTFGPGKVEGSARIQVDFRNAPKGIRTGVHASGIFDEIQVSRGETMRKATD
jgi:hypothetical protein